MTRFLALLCLVTVALLLPSCGGGHPTGSRHGGSRDAYQRRIDRLQLANERAYRAEVRREKRQLRGRVAVFERELTRRVAGQSCGVERWSYKIMTDPRAKDVALRPHRTTVPAINALQPTPPRIGFEARAWVVTAKLTGYRLENDSDLHLILSSGGRSMIAEIPDPACALGSRVIVRIRHARAAFLKAHSLAGQCFRCLDQTVTVTGIGFFDRFHEQVGVAINAAELHPVTGFRVGT